MTDFSFESRWTVAATESHGFKGVWTVNSESEAVDLVGLLLAVGIQTIRYPENYYSEISNMLDKVTV